MQKIIQIFRFLIFSGLVFIVQSASSQQVTNKIIVADSLFDQKKYTESLELYEELLSVQKQYTPQMLLKMAFIKEGLKDYSKALYYLNVYYSKTTDKRTLKKMEKLAKAHELNGYEYTDIQFFTMIYQRYANYISIFLMGISMLVLVFLFKKKERKPIAMGVFLSLILLLLFYHVNNSGFFEKGIITESNAYMMKKPSSGADLVEIIDKGHRVDITDKQDVWLEVEWEGEKGFVREGNVSLVK